MSEKLKAYVLRHPLGQPGGQVVIEFDTDEQMNAILARHQGQDEAKAASVEGWKLVPVEPTETMCASGDRAFYGEENDEQFAPSIYRAMIAAAPQPPHQDARDGRIAALEAFVANVAERHHSSDHYSLATAFERFQTRARALANPQQEA